MERIRAENPAEAFWTLEPFALLEPDDPWHADIESFFDPLHYGMIRQLARRLKSSRGAPDYVHLGVVGHKGTGKSTQVARVMADLSAHEGLVPVFVDALTSFDQVDLSFSDFLWVLIGALVEKLKAMEIEVPQAEYKDFLGWFTEEILTEARYKEILADVGVEAKTKGGIPLLAAVLAKVTATIRSNTSYRKELRHRTEQDAGELISKANELIRAAERALTKQAGTARKIAVVMDNLEKLPERDQVDKAVLRRAEDLRKLRLHLVLFFDPADQYAPVTIQAGQAFEIVTVPMLPIREKGDPPETVDDAVCRAVFEILSKRVEMAAVFEDPEAASRDLARLSGGRLRDIFHLGRSACELADPELVTARHIQLAARRLSAERLTLVAPDHWERMRAIHRAKQVANLPEDAHLLLHSLVLNYNGEPWWDVHPLALLDERFWDG